MSLIVSDSSPAANASDPPCAAAPPTVCQAASPARPGRRSLPGQAYLLGSATRFRRPLFAQPELARTACRTLNERGLWRDSRLLAWVLMPDHWHGLVLLGSLDSLETLMGRVKAVVARRVCASAGDLGGLWSRGFQDRALCASEDLREAGRELVAGPVRAGLAARIGDYPYWNAVWLGEVERRAPRR